MDRVIIMGSKENHHSIFLTNHISLFLGFLNFSVQKNLNIIMRFIHTLNSQDIPSCILYWVIQ